MTVTIRKYDQDMQEEWDSFCQGCINASFLHCMKFITYHQDKFNDQSLMIYSDNRLVALFPAATSLTDSATVVSHPGITYGGLIHQGWLCGLKTLDVLKAICLYYGQLGFNKLIYKVVPSIYNRVPAEDDLYTLFRIGAKNYRTDLSSAIDLNYRLPLSDRRRRALKKAQGNVVVSNDSVFLADFWNVLAENLSAKHDTKPVHSLQELQFLMSMFPENILIKVALLESRVVAGVLLFTTPNVWHAQYIASSEDGYEVSALDAIFNECIQDAELANARYFDFGISNENNGIFLNDGLYRFKTEFGGGGVVHQFFEIGLEGNYVS